VSTLTSTSLANCDGIARDGSGNYYVSAWGTQAIYKFNSTFTGGPALITAGMSNPADIFYNVVQDTLGVPNSGSANNLVLIGFGGSTVGVEETAPGTPQAWFRAASGQLVITADRDLGEVYLLDMHGRVVYARTGQHYAAGEQITVEAGNLADGAYLVRVRGAFGEACSRVIIAR
jgi:hypothetical protein